LTRARLVIARGQLLALTGVKSELVRRFERVGVVVPLAKSAREIYYPAQARPQLERVQTLLSAGYAERDIAHVVGRVSSTERQALESVHELGEVARSLGVEVALLEGFISRDLVIVWGRTEAGEALVGAAELGLVEALVSLSALGLDSSLQDFAATHRGSSTAVNMSELRQSIAARLDVVEAATAVLRKATAALKRKARVKATTESGPAKTARLARLLPKRAEGGRGWGGRTKKGPKE